MNRIENIRAAAQRRDEKINAEERRISQLVEDRMTKIKNRAPRIAELISVANELRNNGFTLGKRTHDGFFEEFVSNGIDHNTGFIILRDDIIGVGIIGHGCNGEDVVWDKNGNYVQELSENSWSDYVIRQKLDKFLLTFDKFEEDFYKFVDSL